MNWIDEAKVTDQDWRGRFSLTAIFCEWISTGLINYIFSKRCQLFAYYVNIYFCKKQREPQQITKSV